MRIAVTGSSGKLGRATVDQLRADGHEVVGFDLTGIPGAGFTRVDLADYGQTLDSMLGVTARHTGLDAVVHLAAIPVNGLVPDAATFQNNIVVSFNVVHAANPPVHPPPRSASPMTKRILVVEDQEHNRRILRDLLTSVGYELIEAATGSEGVRLAGAIART